VKGWKAAEGQCAVGPQPKEKGSPLLSVCVPLMEFVGDINSRAIFICDAIYQIRFLM
jgi:hypothetical protein